MKIQEIKEIVNLPIEDILKTEMILELIAKDKKAFEYINKIFNTVILERENLLK